MEVTGKIILVLPESSGVSKAGKPWKKREYVLETLDSQYPQKIFFDFFGEKADQYPLNIGQVIKLSFDINCHEYNGRWYTNISAWRYEDVADASNAMTQSAPQPVNAPMNPYGAPVLTNDAPPATMPADLAPSGPNDDLPF